MRQLWFCNGDTRELPDTEFINQMQMCSLLCRECTVSNLHNFTFRVFFLCSLNQWLWFLGVFCYTSYQRLLQFWDSAYPNCYILHEMVNLTYAVFTTSQILLQVFCLSVIILLSYWNEIVSARETRLPQKHICSKQAGSYSKVWSHKSTLSKWNHLEKIAVSCWASSVSHLTTESRRL